MRKNTGKNQQIVSVDIGYEKTRIVYMHSGHVQKTIYIDMPEHMMSDGHISAPAAMGDFLKEALKGQGIRCKNMAVILTDEITLLRNVVVPKLPREQMLFNLPFEFRDYIEGELSDHIFDYNEAGLLELEDKSIDILTVAVNKQRVEELRSVAAAMGMHLVKAVPIVCVYEELLQKRFQGTDEKKEQVDGILDVGHGTTRMYVFRHGHYQASHVMDIGISRVYEELSFQYGVDRHLAKTYLETDFENCRKGEACRRAFQEIADEVQKAINLYEFANRVSIGRFWLCGNAIQYQELTDILKQDDSIKMYGIDDETNGLVPFQSEKGERLQEFAQAVGLADSSEDIINLARQEKEKKDHKAMGILIAVLVAFMIPALKFGVFDKFSELYSSKTNVANLQAELSETMSKINEIGEKSEDIYHYTYSDMTEEERNRVKRSDVTEVLSFVLETAKGVKGFRLTENTMEMTIMTASLDELRIMKETLEQKEMVDSFVVRSSSKSSAAASGEEGSSEAVVESQVVIELVKAEPSASASPDVSAEPVETPEPEVPGEVEIQEGD